MATQADLDAALAALLGLANDMSKWFLNVGIEFQRLADARSTRGQAMCDGGAKAAANLGTGINSLMAVFQSFITTNIATARVDFGTDVVTFGGGTGENNTSVGVTGKTWVTANTEVFGQIPYSPLTSDPPSYFFSVSRSTLTVGDGFNFEVYNPNTPLGADYTIRWVALTSL